MNSGEDTLAPQSTTSSTTSTDSICVSDNMGVLSKDLEGNSSNDVPSVTCYRTAHVSAAVSGDYKSDDDVSAENEIRGLTGLFKAIDIDDPAAIARIVVEEGVGVERCHSDDMCTPLYMAASKGSVRLVELLCRLGADVNSKSRSVGNTPLHVASSLGFVRVVEILLDNGADVSATNNLGQTALSIASTQEVGAYLTWWECEASPTSLIAVPSFVDSYRTWVVQQAVSAVSTGLATGLATLPTSTQSEIKSRVSSIDMEMLSFAGVRAYVAERPRLWLLGTPDDYEDDLYAGAGRESAVSSEIRKWETGTAFTASTKSSVGPLNGPMNAQPTISENFEKSKSDKGKCDKEDSVLQDQICKVAMLLGCAPSKLLFSSMVRSDGSTAAHLAANIDAERVLEQLFTVKGAEVKVNTKRRDGQTPLHVAAYRGNAHCCAILLLHGASLNTHDSSSRTALHLASSRGHVHIVAVLLRHGADANAQDTNGNTCAHVAAVNGHDRVLDVLGDEGADVNVLNNQGKTPLDCAVALSQQNVVDLLKGSYAGLRGKEVRAQAVKGERGMIMSAFDNMIDAAYERLLPDAVKSVFALSETMNKLKGTSNKKGKGMSQMRSATDPSEIERRKERVERLFARTSRILVLTMAVAVSVVTVAVSMTGISVIGVSLMGGVDNETLIWVVSVCVVLGAPVVTYLLYKLYAMLNVDEQSISAQPSSSGVSSSIRSGKQTENTANIPARTRPRSTNKAVK
ncbi:hypothetical protein SARC_08654 [Sphaeroforma arctica JP610]|uniref:Uncharacterized protein n=1 Tax=Sphaeroforma arctica JP610 TaxID=667725 RepID=A0A0L0FSI8_9EUKA|nr:hypothetical protein SARC_08654 [Sphaeroforma arctica JP610]KNC78933.1 hypothetical protein SARC_08654 [Sphaeroforma arctica JP610]|eukprot:XP_014152835.1 hypothetical protein SARC_08654 [Sphaeroforma arctica JP610]